MRTLKRSSLCMTQDTFCKKPLICRIRKLCDISATIKSSVALIDCHVRDFTWLDTEEPVYTSKVPLSLEESQRNYYLELNLHILLFVTIGS